VAMYIRLPSPPSSQPHRLFDFSSISPSPEFYLVKSTDNGIRRISVWSASTAPETEIRDVMLVRSERYKSFSFFTYEQANGGFSASI
jgi:hypothetical protein